MSLLNKRYIIFIPFLLVFISGSYLSLNSGISSDEFHEHQNWIINFAVIKNFLDNDIYNQLLDYRDKYHGIAFNIISQPIQFFLKDFVTNYNNVTEYGGLLISKHLVVFIIFFSSGLFFYKIMFKIIQDLNASLLSTILYLTYPYLFGHSLFNPKDIPFLSFWLINTYLFLKIMSDISENIKIRLYDIVMISLTSAFLLSIRIVGILIFFQYLISIILFLNIKEIKFYYFIKSNLSNFFIFILFFLFFLILLNPIFWHNPLEVFNSLKWMSKYPQNVGTLTNGSIMYSLNLPSNYFFIWIFFKLPIIILIGYLIFPFVEKKILINKSISIHYLSLLITPILILLLFIFNNVAVYDEIRHLMFIIPLVMLTSLINLYFFLKKKFFNLVCIIMIIFFSIENYSINPYQYTWLNSFSKFKDIQKNFEIDYWGISNKNLSIKTVNFIETNANIDTSICVYGDHYAKEFLMPKGFSCFFPYSELDVAKDRPFIVFKNLRNVRRSNPKDCNKIWDEQFNYFLFKKSISAATLWYCN